MPYKDMMDQHVGELIKTLVVLAKELAPPILMGVFGGLIQALHNPKIITVSRYTIEILTAAFTAILMHYTVKDSGIAMNYQHVIMGVSGYMSKNVLDAVSRYYLIKLKKRLRDAQKEG